LIMKKVLKWIGIVLGSLVLLLVLAVGAVEAIWLCLQSLPPREYGNR